MKKNLIITAAILIAVMLTSSAAAGQYQNARSLALSKSFTSLARNYQAIGVNPANLALETNNNLSVELFSFGADINNNSFSLADYNKYNGEHLSESDKQDILDKIPDTGLEGNAVGGASGLSFSKGSFAFGISGEGDGRASIDKQVIELIFNGNTFGDSIDISDAFGDGTAHVDFNLSYARELKQFGWGTLNWGVNAKYIYGLQYMEVVDADAYLITEMEGINSQGTFQIKTSGGGSGFGLDAGLSATYNDNWILSMAVTNLISTISWSNDNKLNTYVFSWENLTVQNSDDDSIITSDDYEESIESFSTSLAPQIALGASTRMGSYLLSFDYKQGLKNKGKVSTTPELAAGCEAHLVNFLPLRAGFSVGGANGSSSAIGFGLNLNPFFIDFAYMSTGSLIPLGGKGMGLAVSSGLLF